MIGRKPDIEKILIFEMHCEKAPINEQMPCDSRAGSATARICEFREAHICCACTKHMRFLLYDRAKARHRENFNFRDALRNADLGLRNADTGLRNASCMLRAVAENSKSPYAVLAQGEEREFAIRYENEGLE